MSVSHTLGSTIIRTRSMQHYSDGPILIRTLHICTLFTLHVQTMLKTTDFQLVEFSLYRGFFFFLLFPYNNSRSVHTKTKYNLKTNTLRSSNTSIVESQYNMSENRSASIDYRKNCHIIRLVCIIAPLKNGIDISIQLQQLHDTFENSFA